jgi:hypothetical protein
VLTPLSNRTAVSLFDVASLGIAVLFGLWFV